MLTIRSHDWGMQIECLPSGQPSTLLDLSRVGPELNTWVERQLADAPLSEGWLMVLDGMGRSLESNWNAGEYLKEVTPFVQSTAE